MVAPHVEGVEGGDDRDGVRMSVPEDPGNGLHYARCKVHILVTPSSSKAFPTDVF